MTHRMSATRFYEAIRGPAHVGEHNRTCGVRQLLKVVYGIGEDWYDHTWCDDYYGLEAMDAPTHIPTGATVQVHWMSTCDGRGLAWVETAYVLRPGWDR